MPISYENITFNFKLSYDEVYCPKHKIRLFEIDDGFIKSAFFCPKCKAPYTIGLIKMKKWNKKALSEALKK